MANLKEIRNRITSVSSTMQITSAMKMVSAAKLKKAQDAITAMRPYSKKLTELMRSFSGSAENNKFISQRKLKNILIQNNLKFSDNPIYLGYDPPYKFWGRKNEILLEIE